jgi:hypothetical protein
MVDIHEQVKMWKADGNVFSGIGRVRACIGDIHVQYMWKYVRKMGIHSLGYTVCYVGQSMHGGYHATWISMDRWEYIL